MSLVLQSSGGGQITIQEPATASNFTQTLPAASGEVMVSGNQPAFSAYPSTSQTISNASFTKLQCNTEEFDTNSNYDNATNYRFTPTVAGYYQVNGCVATTAAMAQLFCSVFKNGSEFKRGTQAGSGGAYLFQAGISTIIYLNGSTDYVELYVYQQSGGNATINGNAPALNYFQSAMVRAA
jgi:hypothetical protein